MDDNVPLGAADLIWNRDALGDGSESPAVADAAPATALAFHGLAIRARTAVRDIGHTGIAPVALTLLRADCAEAGVKIPAP